MNMRMAVMLIMRMIVMPVLMPVVVMVRMLGMRHESGLAHRREWKVGTGEANRTNFVDGFGKMRIFV